MLEPGTLLQAKYTIERPLGQGGMGAVYLARMTTLAGKRVAIKEMVVPPTDAESRQRAIAQFQQEAEILAQLEHPNLVDVFDHFAENDHQYLVMALVDGRTLENLLDAGPVTVSQVLAWTDQLCDVLDYLHTQHPPVIFRDMKPSNIMLDVHGQIRLVDFGIARVFDASGKTATFIKGAGTPGYSPLEQFSGGTTDARSDIYALGCTIYSLLTRTVPPVSVALISGEEKLVPLATLNPAVTPALATVVARMMGLRKEDRYQTVREAKTALQSVSGSATTLSAPPALSSPAGLGTDSAGPGGVATIPNPAFSAPPVSRSSSPATTAGLMKVCPHCQTDIGAAAAACFHCGQPVSSTPTVVPCQKCGLTLLPGARSCGHCHTPVGAAPATPDGGLGAKLKGLWSHLSGQ